MAIIVLPTSTTVTRPTFPSFLDESDEILDDYYAQSKLKIIDAGIRINSRKAVHILVDSFARKLGSWATISALGAFMELDYDINEDLRQQNIPIYILYLHWTNMMGPFLNILEHLIVRTTIGRTIFRLEQPLFFFEGIKSVSLTTKMWSNYISGKYTTLTSLQTDASEISLKLTI